MNLITTVVRSALQSVKILRKPTEGRWTGITEWVLTHRLPRLIVPPIILLGLFAFLSIPLLQDLRRLSEDDIAMIQPNQMGDPHDGHLMVNIKNINPNNGVATLDLTYVTDDIDKGKVELW